MKSYTVQLEKVNGRDTATVGGKNASLGEMIQNLSSEGIRVPGGFAVTVAAWRDYIAYNKFESVLDEILTKFNRTTLENLGEVGKQARALILSGSLPEEITASIRKSWMDLKGTNENISVAVRSSASAEDSPSLSFAGQHDSFLNIRTVDELYGAIKKCYASLFNDRAIKYRIDNGIGATLIDLSVGVQLMVRSDLASAGVAFTIEPESGNKNLIYITGAWGLGESVVQGAVTTDEFYFFKNALTAGKNGLVWSQLGQKEIMMTCAADGKNVVSMETPPALRDQFVLNEAELQILANWCLLIEQHYKIPMDIEWAKDGMTGNLYIVQARPETIHNRAAKPSLKEYSLDTKSQAIVSGKAVGKSIVSGTVRIVKSLADSDKVKPGDILVADSTNPDWNALLRKAVSIVTNKGGRTSHASIVARELGIPAVVGTMNATEALKDGQIVTVSCAHGDMAHVYDGKLQWEEKETALAELGHTHTKPMFILADPQKATTLAAYPNEGVGLMRMEFAINSQIQIHPMALARYITLPEGSEKNQITALTRHYADQKEFFIAKLSQAVGLVAAAFYPKSVIVRMSDFKTNEYAKLIGGKFFEPEEENPMLGFRGASRYYDPRYKEGFALECAAIRRVREEMALDNVKVMIPFCRTVGEARKVLDTMNEFGLERGKLGLEVYMMAEIPSNVLLADDFATLFDGFSIGSNDLTQLTLGIDRDSAIVSHLFREDNEAVTTLIQHLIVTAHKKDLHVGLCGQAPSDNPDFARFLVSCGIDSISFNADALLKGIQNIVKAEKDRSVLV